MQRRSVQERAEWFGCTGLGEAAERHLLDYIRLEENQKLSDSDCIKASDLKYVGVVSESPAIVHYWLFRGTNGWQAYASISVTDEYVVCDYGRWTHLHDNYAYS